MWTPLSPKWDSKWFSVWVFVLGREFWGFHAVVFQRTERAIVLIIFCFVLMPPCWSLLNKIKPFRISLLWFIGNQTRFVVVWQKQKNCTYRGHGIIPQGRVVHQFWSEMTCAEEQRRLGCNLTDPFIPLVRPDTGPFNTKAHHNTIEPEVAEKLVKARLGVTNDWKSLHYNWYDWDEDTKVSCAGWSLCLKVSNSVHVSWQSSTEVGWQPQLNIR